MKALIAVAAVASVASTPEPPEVALGAAAPKTMDPQVEAGFVGVSAYGGGSASASKAPGLVDPHPPPKAAGLADPQAKAPSVAVPPKSRAELRRLFLEQSAITLGQSWADQWRDDLRREGRPAAGGWPGTLREARVRIEHHLLAEVTRRKMPAVTEAEREVAARKAYASARAQWCRQAEPEAP